MAFFVEIACAGCGRTQRVRARKVVPCDGYTCSLAGCKKNPDFKLPDVPVKYGIAGTQLIVTEYNPIVSDPDGYVCELYLMRRAHFRAGFSVLLQKRKNVPSSAQSRFGMPP